MQKSLRAQRPQILVTPGVADGNGFSGINASPGGTVFVSYMPGEIRTDFYRCVRGWEACIHSFRIISCCWKYRVFLNCSAIVFLRQKEIKKSKDCIICICQTNWIPLLARITNLYMAGRLANLLKKNSAYSFSEQ